MDKVEERLKEHNDKLMETLRQQREDREKRRRSFHEVFCVYTKNRLKFMKNFLLYFLI
jgi:hypothetical protein